MLAGSHSDNSFCNRDDWFTFGSPRATSSIEVWKINFVLLIDIFYLTRFSNKRFKIVATSFIFCFYFVFSFFSNCHLVQNVEKIGQNIARQEYENDIVKLYVLCIYLLHNSIIVSCRRYDINYYSVLLLISRYYIMLRNETFF